jgi:hypothetical protein
MHVGWILRLTLSTYFEFWGLDLARAVKENIFQFWRHHSWLLCVRATAVCIRNDPLPILVVCASAVLKIALRPTASLPVPFVPGRGDKPVAFSKRFSGSHKLVEQVSCYRLL